jgi:hypothetical protein
MEKIKLTTRIWITLPIDLVELLNEKSEEIGLSNSTIVRRMLNRHLGSFDPRVDDHAHYPITRKEAYHIESPKEEIKGLIIPDSIEQPKEIVLDPEITGTGLKTLERVRRVYIDPALVAKAKRNKDAGRDYDKSLEAYL